MVNKTTGAICAITFSALTAFTPTLATANEMALTFEDQGVTIAGQYAGFRSNAYVLITTAGVIHVPANLVKCDGVDCLEILSAENQDS